MLARVLRPSLVGLVLLLGVSSVGRPLARAADDSQPQQANTEAQPKVAAACCGQQEEGKAQQAQTKEGKVALTRSCACPQYPYMDHGTYVSYYATVCGTTAGTCGTPISYDGPRALALNGDCTSGTNCQQTLAHARDASARPMHRSNDAHPDIIRDGIPAGQEPTDSLKPGATLLNTGVNIIEFRKNTGAGGTLMKAKIFLVEVDPANAQPFHRGGKIVVGSGYSVTTTDTADRSAADNDVITLNRDANSHVVTVLVKIGDNAWREYQIILRNGQNR